MPKQEINISGFRQYMPVESSADIPPHIPSYRENVDTTVSPPGLQAGVPTHEAVNIAPVSEGQRLDFSKMSTVAPLQEEDEFAGVIQVISDPPPRDDPVYPILPAKGETVSAPFFHGRQTTTSIHIASFNLFSGNLQYGHENPLPVSDIPYSIPASDGENIYLSRGEDYKPVWYGRLRHKRWGEDLQSGYVVEDATLEPPTSDAFGLEVEDDPSTKITGRSDILRQAPREIWHWGGIPREQDVVGGGIDYGRKEITDSDSWAYTNADDTYDEEYPYIRLRYFRNDPFTDSTQTAIAASAAIEYECIIAADAASIVSWDPEDKIFYKVSYVYDGYQESPLANLNIIKANNTSIKEAESIAEKTAFDSYFGARAAYKYEIASTDIPQKGGVLEGVNTDAFVQYSTVPVEQAKVFKTETHGSSDDGSNWIYQNGIPEREIRLRIRSDEIPNRVTHINIYSADSSNQVDKTTGIGFQLVYQLDARERL